MEKEPSIIRDVESFLKEQRFKGQEGVSSPEWTRKREIFSLNFINSFFFSEREVDMDNTTLEAQNLFNNFNKWKSTIIMQKDKEDRYNNSVSEELLLDMQVVNSLSLTDVRKRTKRSLDLIKRKLEDSLDDGMVEEEIELLEAVARWTFMFDVVSMAEKIQESQDISEDGFGAKLAEDADMFIRDNLEDKEQ